MSAVRAASPSLGGAADIRSLGPCRRDSSAPTRQQRRSGESTPSPPQSTLARGDPDGYVSPVYWPELVLPPHLGARGLERALHSDNLHQDGGTQASLDALPNTVPMRVCDSLKQ